MLRELEYNVNIKNWKFQISKGLKYIRILSICAIN
jgi:hypothetical protein